MLTEEQLSERLRAGLERELAAINPPEDLGERLRTEGMRPDRAEHGRSRRRRSPGVGDLLAALGTFVALGVVVLAIVMLGHARSTRTASSHAASPPTPRVLQGDSLGSIGFGQPPSTLAAALEPLLGDPLTATRATPTGLVPGICGFSGQMEWRRPIASAGGRSIFDDLVAYFKNSRFVGYTYGEQWTPYGPRPALPPHHRPLLTTPRDLTLEQAVTRARQLYGEAFVQATQPQGTPPSAKLPALPVWRVHTARGELFGGLTSAPRPAIVTINAGAVPNTPCR